MEKEAAPRIRLTISVPADVHATFRRLADASGKSIGWAMGEWLADTLEAAELTTSMVERARAAPKQVMRELNAMALGLADETGLALTAVSQRRTFGSALGHAVGGMTAPQARQPDRRVGSPPSSNTGGKVPRQGQGKGRR